MMLRGSEPDQKVAAAKLMDFQESLFADLRQTFEALANQDNRGRLRVEDLPPSLRDRFVGVSGKHLIQIYPKENVWQREHQEAFVRGRVIIHKEAKEALDRNDFRGICTETERWTRGEAWALMKEGRKGAIKLYDIADDALAAAQAKGDGFYVEHRDGEPIRCAGDYCRVSRWCKQWRSDPRYTP
jgi:hypothetical protein